jgi:hypothetical protein
MRPAPTQERQVKIKNLFYPVVSGLPQIEYTVVGGKGYNFYLYSKHECFKNCNKSQLSKGKSEKFKTASLVYTADSIIDN